MGDESELQIGKDLLTLAQASRYAAEKSFGERDWSGLPMPVPGLSMVLEPRYKHQGIADFRWKECYGENGVREVLEEEQKFEPSEYRRVNSWWNAQYQVTINVAHDKQGRARCYPSFPNRLAFTIRTMEAAAAWLVEAEQKAQSKPATLIPADQFELYQLTGNFAEVSERSQVLYLFRRGRPTIALRQTEEESNTHHQQVSDDLISRAHHSGPSIAIVPDWMETKSTHGSLQDAQFEPASPH